jgi:ElaB/YqjD/DUF883 family membrane-anchored ribosome-binding protein
MENNLTGIQQTNESNRTDWSQGGNGEFSDRESTASPDGIAKTVGGLTDTAHEYTDKISDVVSQAKDYLGDKANIVGEKIKGFATDDLSGLALKAKDFARQKPGQAILVSAAAGVLLGLIIRGRR